MVRKEMNTPDENAVEDLTLKPTQVGTTSRIVAERPLGRRLCVVRRL